MQVEFYVPSYQKKHNNTDMLLHMFRDWTQASGIGDVVTASAHTIKESCTFEKGMPDEKEGEEFDANDEANDDPILMIEQSALKALMKMVAYHTYLCPQPLEEQIESLPGHITSMILKCDDRHSCKWVSSSTIPGTNMFTVNCKMIHAFMTSGAIPAIYKRLCKSAGIGFMGKAMRKSMIGKYICIANL